MKYLFIDTETTGLPQNRNVSPMETNNWPRLVSVAYILSDEKEIVDKGYYIIKPKGFIIPPESTKVHGITTADAISRGMPIADVLEAIKPRIKECNYIVGHNVVFDINVLNAEFYRHDKTLPVSLKPYHCTMMWSKDFCGLPNNKYPTLEELYYILKGESFSDAHNAMADTQAAMDCFWILKDSGIIKPRNKRPDIIIYPTKDNLLWAIDNVLFTYAAKVHAFLTIAYNLKFNNNFIKWHIPTPYSKLKLIIPPKKLIKENNEIKFVDYDENEWIEDSFRFFDSHFSEDGFRNRTIQAVNDFEKEFGGENVIEIFGIKKPHNFLANFQLINESNWLDIAIFASKKRIPLFPQEDEIKSFKQMTNRFNEKREEQNHKEYEKHRELVN